MNMKELLVRLEIAKADRKEMLGILRSEPFYVELYYHIVDNII